MPKIILIVDDDASIRDLLHFMFTHNGFQIISACNGKEGLHLATSLRQDLIISDLDMPVMNGTELVKQITADPEVAAIPIVIFTGTCEIEQAIKTEARKVFFKPSDILALVHYVADVLQPVNVQ